MPAQLEREECVGGRHSVWPDVRVSAAVRVIDGFMTRVNEPDLIGLRCKGVVAVEI